MFQFFCRTIHRDMRSYSRFILIRPAENNGKFVVSDRIRTRRKPSDFWTAALIFIVLWATDYYELSFLYLRGCGFCGFMIIILRVVNLLRSWGFSPPMINGYLCFLQRFQALCLASLMSLVNGDPCTF